MNISSSVVMFWDALPWLFEPRSQPRILVEIVLDGRRTKQGGAPRDMLEPCKEPAPGQQEREKKIAQQELDEGQIQATAEKYQREKERKEGRNEVELPSSWL